MERKVRVYSKLDIDPNFERLSFEELSTNLCEHYQRVRGNSGECGLTGEVVDVMKNGCTNKYNCIKYLNCNGGMK